MDGTTYASAKINVANDCQKLPTIKSYRHAKTNCNKPEEMDGDSKVTLSRLPTHKIRKAPAPLF